MSAPLRLLHVISSLDPQTGGPSEGLRQLGLAQARLGLSCDILVLDAPDAPWLSGFPATVHALGPARMGFQIAPALTGWLQRELARFDGVIVHGLWQLPGRAVRQAARRSQVPYFVFTHGMLDPGLRPRTRSSI